MGLHQNKKLLHSKRIKKIKKQTTQWEKIFSNLMSDKGLISKIYLKLIQLNSENKTQTQLKNG